MPVEKSIERVTRTPNAFALRFNNKNLNIFFIKIILFKKYKIMIDAIKEFKSKFLFSFNFFSFENLTFDNLKTQKELFFYSTFEPRCFFLFDNLNTKSF